MVIRLFGILRCADEQNERRKQNDLFHEEKPVFAVTEVPFVEHNVYRAFTAESRGKRQYPFPMGIRFPGIGDEHTGTSFQNSSSSEASPSAGAPIGLEVYQCIQHLRLTYYS